MKQARRGWFVGATGERGSVGGRIKVLFCYSAGDEPEGLGSRKNGGLQAVYLIFWHLLNIWITCGNFNYLTLLDCDKCALYTYVLIYICNYMAFIIMCIQVVSSLLPLGRTP